MNVIVPGHKYELDYFEGEDKKEIVSFIHKEERKPGELVTLEDGTTNEEILRMMINRMQYLNKKMPCRQNSIVITKLEEALMWMENRTNERKLRGVEGTHLL